MMTKAENYVVRFNHPTKPELNFRHKLHVYERAVQFFWAAVMEVRDENLPNEKWELSLYSYEGKDVPDNRKYLFKLTQFEE